MPFNYDKNSGEFILALSDFSGMLNSRDIDSVLRDDELSGVRNFTRDRLGKAQEIMDAKINITKRRI